MKAKEALNGDENKPVVLSAPCYNTPNTMSDCNCKKHEVSSRRDFLTRCGMGLGSLGLASLLSEEALAAAQSTGGAARATHFPAKAKHVIHIFAQGAPSHVDTWDPKPV